jgi:hypothetical protein
MKVTKSSYDASDGLSSLPASLVVRQPPTEPKIFKESQLSVIFSQNPL